MYTIRSTCIYFVCYLYFEFKLFLSIFVAVNTLQNNSHFYVRFWAIIIFSNAFFIRFILFSITCVAFRNFKPMSRGTVFLKTVQQLLLSSIGQDSWWSWIHLFPSRYTSALKLFALGRACWSIGILICITRKLILPLWQGIEICKNTL